MIELALIPSDQILSIVLGAILLIFYSTHHRSISTAIGTANAAADAKQPRDSSECECECDWPPTPKERHWLWKHAKALRSKNHGDDSSHDILFLQWMQKLQSKVVMFEVPVLGKLIVIGDVAVARHVLRAKVAVVSDGKTTNTCAFPKSPTYRKNRPLLGSKSIVTMEGSEWAHYRRVFAPGFSPSYLRGIVGTVATKCDRFLRACDKHDIAHQQSTNMLARAIDLTSDVIAQVAFGEDWGYGGDEDDEPSTTSFSGDNDTDNDNPRRHHRNGGIQTLSDFRELIDIIAALKNPIQRLNLRSKWRMSELEKSLDEDMKRLVERRIDYIRKQQQQQQQQTTTKGEEEEQPEAAPNDILSLALSGVLSEHNQPCESSSTQNTNNASSSEIAISDHEMECMVSQLKTFYFAGHDTTATTIAWAFWSLLQNPGALQTARDEVLQHLGQDWVTTVEQKPTASSIIPKDSTTYEILQNCRYLDAVAKETLRLYPPAQTARHSHLDPNATCGNYKIGGSVLVLNFYAMQRDPDFWGPDAETFRPERFLGTEGRALANSFAFLPFSRGSRDCIGKYFALLEIKIALAALVTRYDGKAVDAHKEVLTARLTSIPKNGCLVKLARRSHDDDAAASPVEA